MTAAAPTRRDRRINVIPTTRLEKESWRRAGASAFHPWGMAAAAELKRKAEPGWDLSDLTLSAEVSLR